MNFLITNDDGFDAPGLAALFNALRPLGTVTVVAPATCHSAKGHAVDTKTPLRLERRIVEPFGDIFILHSSPADCVRAGLRHVMQDPPDYVIAGINPGANLGVDLFYSGTAAAAREAAILGIPSVALSRLMHTEFPVDWDILSVHATRVLRTLLTDQFRLPAGHFWNVNFPTVADEQYPDEITFAPQDTDPHAVTFRVVDRTGDSEILEYSAAYRDRGCSDRCDVKQLFNQRLTATPVGPSMTLAMPNLMHSRVSLFDASCAD